MGAVASSSAGSACGRSSASAPADRHRPGGPGAPAAGIAAVGVHSRVRSRDRGSVAGLGPLHGVVASIGAALTPKRVDCDAAGPGSGSGEGDGDEGSGGGGGGGGDASERPSSASALLDVAVEDGLIDRAMRDYRRPFRGSLTTFTRSSKQQIHTWDGFAADLTKSFEDPAGEAALSVGQSFNLGRTDIQNPSNSNWQLVSMYISGSRLLQGVLLPDQVLSATYIDKFAGGAVEVRVDGQFTGDASQAVGTGHVTLNGDDYAVEGKVNMGAGQGSLGGAYMQSVSPRWTLGLEANWMAAYRKLDYTAVAQFHSSPRTFYAASLNRATNSLSCLYKNALEDGRLTYYGELQAALQPDQNTGQNLVVSHVTLGYDYVVRREPAGPPDPRTGEQHWVPYTTLRTNWASDGKIQMTIDHLTLGGQGKLKLSAAMNHGTRDYRFGSGFELQY